MSGKCKVESGQCRNCVAIVMPPSDEGGGKIFDFDGGIVSNVKQSPTRHSREPPLHKGALDSYPFTGCRACNAII